MQNPMKETWWDKDWEGYGKKHSWTIDGTNAALEWRFEGIAEKNHSRLDRKMDFWLFKHL